MSVQRLEYLLMMIISDPRKSAESADHDGNIREDSHNEDCVVTNFHMREVVDHFVEQPCHSRKSASAVDTSKMLEKNI